MSSVQQVAGTLLPAFCKQFPSTYAIIDGSEIFLETPTDLDMQSSTWNNYYKHHNTAKTVINFMTLSYYYYNTNFNSRFYLERSRIGRPSACRGLTIQDPNNYQRKLQV